MQRNSNHASETLRLRPLEEADNAAIASVIRCVSAEFGLTSDKGYTVADRNLDALFTLYHQPRHAYWVVEHHSTVIGGGGIAPLACGAPNMCELQKMYFLPQARGTGLARQLVENALSFARTQGFSHCYLETTGFLKQAVALYERAGFTHIDGLLGCTGHVDCEVRMLKTL